MSRAAKTQTVAELTEQFNNSNGAVLTEYRGLTVAHLRQLRNALRGNADYTIVKNTLTKIAAKDAGVEGFDELLVGPSAIAFVTGDVVEAAKGLRNFGREHPQLVVKGGFMEGRALSPDEVRTLADLESREVLLAKLAGAMKASLAGAAALFQAPLSQAARTVDALRAKAEEDPSILAAGAGEQAAAAAEPAAAAVEPAEEPASDQAEASAAADESSAGEQPADAEAPAEAPAGDEPAPQEG
jgi:large subunit ribosomal protein L10